MIKTLTKNVISLKTCLLNSQTGEELQYDMTVVLILSSLLVALPLALSFILINDPDRSKLNPQRLKTYEEVKDLLAQGMPGKNQHVLTGDRKRTWAIDLT